MGDTLIVETIDSVDTRTFMVSSQQEEILRVLDLVGEEEAYCFEGLFAAVHIIAQEKVVALRGVTAILEET